METIWFMWAVAFVLVITGKNEAAITGTASWALWPLWRSAVCLLGSEMRAGLSSKWSQ
jgi:hypothetical protein